jgi:hypothetical protein
MLRGETACGAKVGGGEGKGGFEEGDVGGEGDGAGGHIEVEDRGHCGHFCGKNGAGVDRTCVVWGFELEAVQDGMSFGKIGMVYIVVVIGDLFAYRCSSSLIGWGCCGSQRFTGLIPLCRLR